MNTKILCTLGPASLRPEIIAALDARHVDLFRINLSHTPLEDVERTVRMLQQLSSTPICLDTEGAQVRCGVMEAGVVLAQDRTIRLESQPIEGSSARLTLWPASLFTTLEAGSRISVDFDGALLRVTAVEGGSADAVVVESGRVRSNRAVTIHPPPVLPTLTDKDLRAVEIGVQCGLRHFALSFAASAADVQRLRGLVPADTYIIAKIESRAGVRNMDGIIGAADAVLIDRGDLSREIAIEHVPVYQKHIIRRANTWNTPVFVATNLLESMVEHPTPTVAEANDIVNTLLDGAHGLVLAAETAIGAHPVRAIDMVRRLIDAFEHSTARLVADEPVVA
jgi:pyruvate kinase